MSNTRLRSLSWGALLALVTVLAYLPALQAGFIWDDDSYVTANPGIRSIEGLATIWTEPLASPQYYPLVFTSFFLEYQLYGLEPMGYHLVNILLHVAGALVLWRLLLRLSVPGAWLVAAVFALHPVHVESVAWITERKNVLSGLFYLLAATAYLRFSPPEDRPPRPNEARWSWYALALLLMVCALLSKSVTATLPAALLVVIWWKRGRLVRWDWLWTAPLFVLGATLGWHTASLERAHVGAVGHWWDYSLIERVVIAGRATWFYATKLLWPEPLSFIYPRWEIDATQAWQLALPIAAAGLVIGLWLARKRIGRGPAAGLLFFGGTLLPALGFFNVYPMRFSFVADHFQYLASLGLLTLIVGGAAHLAHRRQALPRAAQVIAAGALLAVLGTLTFRQALVYKDLETLWRDTIAKNPQGPMPHNNLAVELRRQGRTEEALEHYRVALALDPDYDEARINLARALYAQGKAEQSLAQLEEAVRRNPDSWLAWKNLGELHLQEGREQPAAAAFSRSVELNPRSVESLLPLARLLTEAGQVEQAAHAWQQVMTLAPQEAEAPMWLGILHARQGRSERAIALFQQAHQLGAERAAMQLEWGLCLVRLGRLAEGAHRLEQAAAADPSLWQARLLLGSLLLESNQDRQAEAHLRAVLEQKPGHPRAVAQLAWLLASSADESLRRPEEALALAQRLVEAQPEDVVALDTLGAALAAAGRYDAAQAAGQRAVDLARAAGRHGLAQQIEVRLAQYRQRRPWRRAGGGGG